MKRTITSFALVLAVAMVTFADLASSAGKTVYRWKDAQGNPVNSDRPPPAGIDYEVISTTSTMVRPVDASEGAVPPKVQPSPSNPFDPVDTSEPRIVKNPEFCQRARENLEVLDMNVRIQMRDDQGEVYYLSEEDREVQRQRAQDTIRTHCE